LSFVRSVFRHCTDLARTWDSPKEVDEADCRDPTGQPARHGRVRRRTGVGFAFEPVGDGARALTEDHGDQVRATSHPIPIDRQLLNFGRRAELGPENGAVSSLDPSIAAHYEQGSEAQRLAGGFPSGPLELARTQELIARHFPAAPTDVLDVGGGPGVYARWLAGLGYRVHVVDPIPLHVEQARTSHPQVTAELGDARQLSQASGSVAVVLLLGPLYHLLERRERLTALREARRVLRPEGLLFAAAISRRFHEPEVHRIVEATIGTGIHRGAEHDLFTTAYFHRPEELRTETTESGMEVVDLLNIEGPGFVIQDFESRWSDPARRQALLDAARLVERDPSLLGMSSHLLMIATRPPDHPNTIVT